MSISSWFKSPATPAQPTPLEKAKQANPQIATALQAEQDELDNVKEMSILLEERNRIKAERLELKTTTVAALDKFAELYKAEEEIDVLLTDKLSKWGF